MTYQIELITKLFSESERLLSLANRKEIVDPYQAKCQSCLRASDVPGSAHTQCEYGLSVNPEMVLIHDMGLVPMIEATVYHAGNIHNLKIAGLAFEVSMIRFFIWPYDFDPTWLKYCFFFKEKTK